MNQINEVKLFTRDGVFVKIVPMPVFPVGKEPNGILHNGAYYFMRDSCLAYYEGYIVQALMINPPEEDKKSGPYGDDKFLFGLPKNLEEAIETFIEFYSNGTDWSALIEGTEDGFVGAAHHFSGQFIRNNWFLWWHEGHKYESWPLSRPPIVAFFNNLGITHADDMSGIILHSVFRTKKGLEIKLDEQINMYKKFWREQGFKGGIFKPGAND